MLLNGVKVYLEIHARENKIRTHYMVISLTLKR
jgi:hypothetical protein